MSIAAYKLMELTDKAPQVYEGRRYKVVFGNVKDYYGNDYEEVFVNDEGYLQVKSEAGVIHTAYLSDYTELEELEEYGEVSIFEALTAYNEGKNVWCKVGDDIYVYEGEHAKVHDVVYTKEILEGKWFIEQGGEGI